MKSNTIVFVVLTIIANSSNLFSGESKTPTLPETLEGMLSDFQGLPPEKQYEVFEVLLDSPYYPVEKKAQDIARISRVSKTFKLMAEDLTFKSKVCHIKLKAIQSKLWKKWDLKKREDDFDLTPFQSDDINVVGTDGKTLLIDILDFNNAFKIRLPFNDLYNIVRELLTCGADPNEYFLDPQSLQNISAIYYTLRQYTPRNNYTYDDREKLLRLLIKFGAKIDLKDGNGETELMHMVKHWSFEDVVLLLQLGANPNLQNLEGDTPLMMAARGVRGNELGMINILLNTGAKVLEFKNNLHQTALDIAKMRYDANRSDQQKLKILKRLQQAAIKECPRCVVQ